MSNMERLAAAMKGATLAYDVGYRNAWNDRADELDRIKEQVQAEERERWAKYVEDYPKPHGPRLAAAIREADK